MNADLDTIDAEIARPRIPFNSPTVGATTTCDLALGRVFVFTVSQATTLAFTNVPAATFACRIRLLITNGSAFLITWPAAVTWLAGIIPTFKASGVDEVELVTKDAGTTWYAALRNLRPGVIYQNNLLNTTSVSDVSLASYSLPANTLTVNGQTLRLTVVGHMNTQTGTINIKFGAGTVLNHAAVPASSNFSVVLFVTRTGAATQRLGGMWISSTSATDSSSNAGAETLSGAVLVDFRGSVTSGGTLFYDTILVEYLST